MRHVNIRVNFFEGGGRSCDVVSSGRILMNMWLF